MSPQLLSQSERVLLYFGIGVLVFPILAGAAGAGGGFSFWPGSLLQSQTAPREDPFYKKLYDEGKFFYQNKNYAQAIDDFGIAFFGYLDNRPRLLECYVYLAVCHFEQKNYEKAKYYIEENRRLELDPQMKDANLPEGLTKRYQEIIGKLYRATAVKPTAK